MKKQNYEPAKAKIYLEIDAKKDISDFEIEGKIEDLVFLLSIPIQKNPAFLEVLKLAIDFNDYENNKNKLLRKAYEFCDENNKSTEFMLIYARSSRC